MSGLGRPAVVSSLLVAAAIALHPALGAATWLPERDLVAAALLLLAALALAARAAGAPAAERAGSWLAAAGAFAFVVALGADGVLGHHGSLALGVGQARGHFDERAGSRGRSLGLRPLGFNVGVESVGSDGAVRLAFGAGDAAAELREGRAVSHGGYRFAHPRVAPTGGVSRLRLTVSDGTRTTPVDLVPGQVVEAAGLQIALEQYFPDFALDAQQQPYTRSLEANNPAALLTVVRGGETHRAFVLESMPGLHRIEGLGLSFSLLGVEPERSVEMTVDREPAAPLALAGGLLLAAAVLFGAWSAWRSGAGAVVVDPPLVAGAALALSLAIVDHGAVLAWRLAVPAASGPLPIAGAGLFLGLSLLLALLGTLLLAAEDAAGAGASVRPGGRVSLWAAVAAAAVGLLVAAIQAAAASDVTLATARPLAGLFVAAALVACALWITGRPSAPDRVAAVALPLAVALALVAAVVAGAQSLLGDGTYAAPGAVAAAAAAMLGLAALPPTGLVAARRLAFLVALLVLLVRPL